MNIQTVLVIAVTSGVTSVINNIVSHLFDMYKNRKGPGIMEIVRDKIDSMKGAQFCEPYSKEEKFKSAKNITDLLQ